MANSCSVPRPIRVAVLSQEERTNRALTSVHEGHIEMPSSIVVYSALNVVAVTTQLVAVKALKTACARRGQHVLTVYRLHRYWKYNNRPPV